MPMWPADFPEPVHNSITIGSPMNATIRSSMDAGPAKTRARVTAASYPITMDIEPMTEDQIGRFLDFYMRDLVCGALIFEMPHPLSGNVRRFRFLGEDDQYNTTPIGIDAYRLSLSMEVLP